MAKRWITYPNAVWCDVHGTHHDKSKHPYDHHDPGPPYECGPQTWRNLAILATSEEEF
jgi:hypothetical protein